MPEKGYQKVKESIKNLVNMLRRVVSIPISFQTFLKQTGLNFDHYILTISQQEGLNYIGGKMVLQLIHDQSRTVDSIPIRLSAELYFQTADKQWVVKQKQGQVDSTRFTDWDTNEMAAVLQQTGILEWSIESPDKLGHEQYFG